MLHEAMGDRKSALPLHEQALALRKEVLGETHPDHIETTTRPEARPVKVRP
jgi:hypothetical protein